MIYLLADTETDGLAKPIHVVEVALRMIEPETLDTLREWQSLIDPGVPIPEATTKIHGITDEMVQFAPTMHEFIARDLHGGFKEDITVICHNVNFDLPLLTGIGAITRSICTLEWSRQIVHDAPNCKLQTLRQHFGIPENAAHRAMADVDTVHQLLKILLVKSGRTLDNLAQTTSQVIHVMPWGMHKGKLLIHVPSDYLDWLLTKEDLDTNLRVSAQRARRMTKHG